MEPLSLDGGGRSPFKGKELVGAESEGEEYSPSTPGGSRGPCSGHGYIYASFAFFIFLLGLVQHGIIPVPGLHPGHRVYFPIIVIFISGYIVIVLEEQTSINKAATSLVLGVLVWAFVGTGAGMGALDDVSPALLKHDVHKALIDVAEVVFFLLGALTIVEIMDMHRGFDIITKLITATKSRDLLVTVSIITFLLSSVLNNLTVVIVMISLVQKVVADDELRKRLGGIVAVASNAGGAWTPIGDITTTMLYIGGQVTLLPLVTNLLIPSILNMIGAVGFEYCRMDGSAEFERPRREGADPELSDEELSDEEAPDGQAFVFWSGITGMVMVPVFTAVTQCPAWSGMMLVLGLLGVAISLIHGPHEKRYTLKAALTRVEVTDALFFLGILFAVGALERIGLLKALTVLINGYIPSNEVVALLLGFASAVVDNVPLVAATQGMYSMEEFPSNDPQWNLITYCASTGGSLLVIGSAAGVAFMGLEKGVSFGWYVRTITPCALCGYFLGAAGVLIQQWLGLAMK